MLSQLNRNLETPERVNNPFMHYPTKNDMFGASSVYYCSDVVIISHKPSVISALGKEKFYGPPTKGYPKGLPIFHPQEKDRPMIYWHIIKERFGENKILAMVDDFKHSRVLEY